ncbi:MAG: serine hydrolase domain-containing protein [Pseudomonadota bacterium]
MRSIALRLCALTAIAATLFAGPAGATEDRPLPLESLAAATRSVGVIPGLTAMAYRDGRFQSAAVGQRRASQPARIRLDDRLHVGSNLKSMTASVVAILVERRRLRWEATLSELFPGLAMRPEYRTVTVEQLLHPRGGVVSLRSIDEVAQAPAFDGTPVEQRAAFAAWALSREPETPVGTFGYSNGGYALVGAIIERAAGIPYERAMQRHLFNPLRIDAVFGWPATFDRRAPWGHYDDAGSVVETDPADPQFVFPAWLRAAGDASMNAADYARYLAWHAEGRCGKTALLRRASFERMHAVPASEDGEPYSMGWSEIVAEDGRTVSVHSGSAGNFYTTAAIDDRCERGIAILANSGSTAAGEAVEAAVLEWMR